MIHLAKTTVVVLLACAFVSFAHSQEADKKSSEYCSFKKRNNPNPLPQHELSPGTPTHSFDVLDYRLEAGTFVQTKSLLLIK